MCQRKPIYQRNLMCQRNPVCQSSTILGYFPLDVQILFHYISLWSEQSQISFKKFCWFEMLCRKIAWKIALTMDMGRTKFQNLTQILFVFSFSRYHAKYFFPLSIESSKKDFNMIVFLFFLPFFNFISFEFMDLLG